MISSVEEFRKVLGVGDIFWYITTSFYRAPNEVEGPCTIISYKEDENENEQGVVFQKRDGTFISRYIFDITNEWHGVFLTEEEAVTHFQERKNAYITDPAFIAEERRAREFCELAELVDEDQYYDFFGDEFGDEPEFDWDEMY